MATRKDEQYIVIFTVNNYTRKQEQKNTSYYVCWMSLSCDVVMGMTGKCKVNSLSRKVFSTET